MRAIGLILVIIGGIILVLTIGYWLFWLHWGVGLFIIGLLLVCGGAAILENY